MFVRVAKKDKNNVSVRVVENHRCKTTGKVKQKSFCCVGYAHKDDHGKIESLKEAARNIIPTLKNDVQPVLPGFDKNVVYAPKTRHPSYENLVEEERLRTGIDDVFSHEYMQSGLFETIDKGYKKDGANNLLKEMVMARIDKPSSKRKSVINLERDRGEALSLDSVYRMMDKLAEREEWVKGRVAKRTVGLFRQKIHLAFFDVTTVYFESFIPDELRVSGYSKDNKVKETQVVFALMTTTDGLPLDCELFPGNTAEGGTLISAVDTLSKKYDVADVTIVADRAMFSKKNLEELDKKGVDFIVSATLKKMGKDTVEKIKSDVEEVLEKAEESKEKVDFWHGEYEHGGRRLVVGYSAKRAAKDKKDRERLLERVKKKTKDGRVKVSDLVKNTGTKKYLKLEKKNKETAVIDEDKIAEAQRWDGIYGIVTSHDKEEVSGADVFGRYRGLWQAEDAFRVNKHDLKMRPVYHWTPKRIRAHILICYMSYALVSTVRHKLKKAGVGMSVARIREELGYLQASVVRDKKTGKKFLLPSKVTPEQREIYRALGLKLEEKVRFLN